MLWQTLRLGRMPYPLDVPSEGATEQDVKTLQDRTIGELRRRGLADDARLEDLLRLLGDHEVSVDAVAGLDRTIRALAAANGPGAVLAVIDGEKVGLSEIRPTALAREIVRVLPEGVAGPGSALSVRLETLQQAVALQEAEQEEDSEDPWGAADEELDDREALLKAGLSAAGRAADGRLAQTRVAGRQFGVTPGGTAPTWSSTGSTPTRVAT